MPIQVRCRCGNKWQVDDDLDGKTIRCSSCDKSVVAAKPSNSRLYLLILVAFTLAAVAYLIVRWAEFAEESRKIYSARGKIDRVALSQQGVGGRTAEPSAAAHRGGV